MASSRFQQLSHRYWDSWLPELVALVFSTLCLLGLVILLSQCDQKPTFDWHGVTVNALVAVLSTLSRASLMAALANTIGQTKWSQFMRGPRSLYWLEIVDGASRDAWGRVSLLCKSPFGIASLGALAALLTLAFDPFTQQLIATESRLTFTNATAARIPQAYRYGLGLINANKTVGPKVKFCDGSEGAEGGGSSSTPDFSMQAAILNGIREGSTTEQLGVNSRTCATGNCTWPFYRSLAVCHECFDIRSKINRISAQDQQMSLTVYVPGGTPFSSINTTALLLPNNLYLTNEAGSQWDGNFTNARTDSSGLNSVPMMLMTTYGTSSEDHTNAFVNASTLIWAQSFLRLKTPQSLRTQLTKPWPDTDVEAIECGLYWCVKEYNSTVVNGFPEETTTQPTHTEVQRDDDSWQVVPPNHTLSDYDLALGHFPAPIPTLTPKQLRNLTGIGCLSKIDRTDLRIERTFNISQGAVWGAAQYLSQMFTLGFDLHEKRPSGNNSNATTDWPPTFNGFYALPYIPQWSPVVMKTMIQTENLENRFRNLAVSMSNSIRSYADGAPQAVGDTGYVHVVVTVRWLWIVFPAIVWVLALTQFIIAMAITKHSGAPIWKSSALALLSRGENCARLLNQQGTVSQIEHAAKQHRVDLFEDGVPEKGGLVIRTRSRMGDEDGGMYNRKKPTTRVRWT